MSVKINIHKTHRRHTDNSETVEVQGHTVGECLLDLVEQFPGLRYEIFNKEGNLLNIIEIYVNMESAYPDELKKPVKDRDEIFITIMLAGG